MKNTNINNGNESNKKIKNFIVVIAILFFIYLFRLAYLQIFDVDSYKAKGDNLIIKREVVNPDRGAIYDRNKNPLAVNLQYYTAYVSVALPQSEKAKLLEEYKGIDKSKRENQELIEKYEKRTSLPEYTYDEIDKLARILKISSRDILSKLEKEVSGPIAFKVTSEQKKEIEDLKLRYISFYSESDRYYYGKEMFSNTIGFVENGEGLYGLEKQYNDILSGEKGYREFYKAIGNTILPFESSKKVEGENAKSIVTTLDENFQKIIHEKLVENFMYQKPMYTTAILSNPNTGEILAMESIPTFDPNNPRALDSEVDKLFLDHLKEDQINDYMVSRWNNLNISSVYEPGSTFKAVTTAIALDSNRDIESNIYNCTGSIEISPGVRIRCWRVGFPHGDQTLMEAFSNSCNPAYVQILDDIGRENFVAYGKGLKYGETTGIDMPGEQAGVFPQNTNIKDVDFRPMSYGHSISTTPIQQSMALNATINGGVYYRPYLVKEVLDENNRVTETKDVQEVSRVISEQTSSTMREFFLNNSVQSGYFESNPLKIGYKTGTTEVVNAQNILDDKERAADAPLRTITSIFAIYPSDAPKYSLFIVSAYPTKDDLAGYLTPLAKRILEEIEDVDTKKAPKEVTESKFTKVPDITGKPIITAIEELKGQNINLSYDTANIGQFEIITKQYPQADGYIENGGHIEVEVGEDGDIMVPNLVGMTVENATSYLDNNKIKYQVQEGDDKITKQIPQAGSIMKKGEAIELITIDN